MKSVVRFTLKQVVFMNVVFVLLIVAGVMSMFTSPVENMPPVDIGKVFISTVYFGASAEDVESLVTKKIEDALDGMENIEFIQSRSRRNTSTVEVKFIDDTDYEDLYDELRFRVQNIREEFPMGTDEPVYFYLDTQMWMPVLTLNVIADMPNRSLKLVADELKTEIEAIDAVREVTLLGEYEKEFHVSVDPEKLRRAGITFEQVASAIESANTKLPTGRFRTGESEFMLDAGSRLSSQLEVLEVVVRRDGDGNFLRVRDLVTTAMFDYQDPSVIQSANGRNTISLLVKKEDRGNAITIVEQAKDISERFEEENASENLHIRYTWDSTVEIHDSINTLGGNMVLGMLLVILVLWFTVGFRNAMLAAVGIPFSFLCAVIIVKITGMSINTITLFSFVLISGIIVDDAVIMIENVYRHMQMGKSMHDAVVDGIGEVMLPVISTAITTVLAFVPMLIMTGSTGEFFAVIPKTVSFALIASLFEALFILPIHILDWGPRTAPRAEGSSEDIDAHLKKGIFRVPWRIYYGLLRVLLENKVKTVMGAILLLIVAVAILVLSMTGVVPLIKMEFFPASFFRYYVVMQMPPESSIERTDEVVRDLSEYIMSLGEGQAYATAGSAGMYQSEDYVVHYAHNVGQVVVTLPAEKEREFPDNPKNDTVLHLDYMRERVDAYVTEEFGVDPALRPRLQIFAENTGPPTGKPVNIRILGNTRGSAEAAAARLMEYLRGSEEFADLVDLENDMPQLQRAVRYAPKQEAAFEYGLPPGTVTALVAGALNGRPAGKFRDREEEVDLMVRLARTDDEGNFRRAGISRPEEVLDVPIVEHSASPVFIRDIVDLQFATEPVIRNRYNGKSSVTITAGIKSGSRLTPSRAMVLSKRYFDSIAQEHEGVTVAFGGEFETTKKSYTSLTYAFIISLFAIYLVLSSQFKDYLQPAIIISAVFFALIGVVFGMFVTRSTFTVGSFLAVVGLAGVAVNDSLILIDFINVRRREGMTLRKAVLAGASARMRPVLITTLTTTLALLPMAIGIPRKSITWSPMATAFVTGLSSATFLTLLMIPVEYELAERLRVFIRRCCGLPIEIDKYSTKKGAEQ